MPANDDTPRGVPDDGSTDNTALAPPGSLGGAAPHPALLGRGDRIGPYVLIDKLGAGTFGEVWKAEQKEPVRRHVAMKVLHAGSNSVAVVGRFRAEQQALAMMDHPGIAKVFDAGLTPSGLPYFVMQYVKGDTLMAYCDRERMTLTQRLELFALVCDAVHHAHQKGIIHRDLKPQNIVVTTNDAGEAQPVVVDFGVAKALTLPLTDATVYSVLGGPQGTWAYMSPEQAEGLADIDTRSDIYSLGVVLYELLSGVRPFDDETFKDASDEAKRKVIREKEPPSPGARVERDTTGTGTKSAENRGTHVRELAKTLRGELSWIPLYAIRKDRKRRYESAAALAADVRDYLGGKPLKAGPESAGYRAAKFVGRNRVLVGSVGGAISALAVGLGVAYWQWTIALESAKRWSEETRRADAKAEEAERARDTIERNAYAASIEMASAAIDQRRFDLARQRIDACPKHLRGWGWGYMRSIADESLFVFSDPGIRIIDAQFGEGNDRIITLSADGCVREWNANNGELLFTCSTLPSYLELTARGGIASKRGASSKGQDSSNEKDRKAGLVPLWRTTDSVLSDDGLSVLHQYADDRAEVCSLTSGSFINLDSQASQATAKFSSDGSRVIAVNGEKVSMFDLRTGALSEIRSSARVVSAEFSADSSRVLFRTFFDDVGIWNFRSDVLTWTTFHSFDDYECLGLASDNDRVLVMDDRRILISRLSTGDTSEIRLNSPSKARSRWGFTSRPFLLFSPDGERVLAVTDSGEAYALNIETRTSVALDGDPVKCASFNGDSSKIVMGSTDGTVRVCTVPSYHTVELRGHTSAVQTCDFSPDSARVVSTSSDGTARLWESAGSTRWDSVQVGPLFQVTAAAFSPSGSRIATGSRDYTARVWDLANQTSVELKGHTGWVRSAAMSPDGLRVVTASEDGTARAWDLATQTSVELKGHTEGLTSAAFSPDGSHVLTVSEDGTARVWDLATQTNVELQGHAESVNSAAFGLYSSWVVTACEDGSARVWDLATQTSVELKGHTEGLTSAAFSPDGSHVVTAAWDNTARIWDLATQTSVELKGHTEGLTSAAFSPDGSHVVTAAWDNTARVWDLGTRTSIELKGHTGRLTSAAFSPDGSRVITACSDGTALIWDCVPNRIRYAERQANARGEDGSRIVQQWIEENLASGFGKPPVKSSP